MKKTAFLISILLFFNDLHAQVVKNMYAASSIPKSLLKDAHAVVRLYNVSFTVKNISTAIEKEHTIVTILDEQSKNYAEQYFWYSKISKIDDIEAAVYDSKGKLVRKMKQEEIYDVKPYTEDISDSRVKRLDFPLLPYPYTIEYTVTTRHNGLLHYPQWSPQQDNKTAIESATFDVTLPDNMTALRYKSLNGAGEPLKSKTDEGKRSLWTLQNINAFAREPFTPSELNLPEVIIAPTEFKIEGHTGVMSSWQSLGAFLNKLGEGRAVLSVEKKAFLKNLVADCTDIPCKVEKIYAHLQATTRYFSIQLGIGGWQPIAATDIERRKYGDCKALSNYMVAMLDVVGVEGRYVIIKAGANNKMQYEDFPNAHFNHAIACVPMQNDTIWLECTSQTESCGFASSFTNDRMALLVTPEGGQIAHTPRYDERVNTIKKTATIKLDTEGSAETAVEIVYAGIKQNVASELAELNPDFRKKYIYETLKIDNATILDMTFKRNKARIPSVFQSLKLTIEPLASKTGKRLFVPINVFSKFNNVPTLDSVRRFDIQADENGFTEQDSVVLKLPEGFKSETKFAPLSIVSEFGSFDMTLTEKSPTECLFYRKLVLNNKILPKEKFGELVNFLKNVAKADKTKLILVQTGS